MKRVFSLLLFFVAAMSVQTVQAQTNGDVNGDGKVDEQDIAAILKIMAEAGGVKEQTKYYWYVGQENPASMTSISPIVDDNTSPGWRLIGTSVPTYSASKMLWEGSVNPIKTGETKQTIYVALPNPTIKLRDGDGNDATDMYINLETKQINGVDYHIYQSPVAGKSFVWDIY